MTSGGFSLEAEWWGLSGDAQNHFDPLWGMVDPAAGAWFPEQALELAQKANPPLL